jgi:uncharacterized protein with GYD domain
MAKYLIIVNYSADGIKAVLDKGGSARRDIAEAAAKSVGGKLESFHFAFGDDDAYVIAELPSNEAAASLAMTVSASGMVNAKTVVLLTPEEIDRAASAKVTYTPPGG